ncbi:MAG TPA: hypothetical protein VHZ51_30605 [Ktedonobacteraceae bacterium]|nr:hypothetical protein [Ktedonobacteraceae bacterium]
MVFATDLGLAAAAAEVAEVAAAIVTAAFIAAAFIAAAAARAAALTAARTAALTAATATAPATTHLVHVFLRQFDDTGRKFKHSVHVHSLLSDGALQRTSV